MIRRPPRSTLSSSSAASDVYKRQSYDGSEKVNRPDELDADQMAGWCRWEALRQAAQDAEALQWTVPGKLFECANLFFGYGEDEAFAFSIPPSTAAGWDINAAMVASHYSDQDSKPTGEKARKVEGIGRDKVLENDGLFQVESEMDSMFEAIAETERWDEDEDELADKTRNQAVVAQWHTNLKALPFYDQLLWCSGEHQDCDATVLFIYYENEKAGVVSGIWVKRAW
eukprot:TRINITY_DN55378_c0_g1_i1.p1 TRINITY_DN55378_c0_g1~~TRINITY_DN55378_c0_g1_i1.p1  ORF type:complete len:227 (-),score=43.17 TRINITY_DN55378_c0_g1_i1:250-930(-)